MSDRETTDGSSGGDRSETDDAQFLPGTVVVDKEDPEPTAAIVINRPPCTCEEWVAYHDHETDEEVTVAEDNPEYDAESELIVVAFRETLEEEDPEKLPIEEPVALAELESRHYGFPKPRLQIVADTDSPSSDQPDSPVGAENSLSESETESEAGDHDTGSSSGELRTQDAVDGSDEEDGRSEKRELSPEMMALRDRVADSATVTVEWEGSTPRMSVEKLGTTYEILPDGTIEGDGALRDQYRSLVEEYLDVDE